MKTVSLTLTKTISLNAVMAYQHAGMVERLQDKLAITEAQATELFADVKRFLYLCATTAASLAPTKAIDEGWHHFILHTADYAAFCSRHFGKMVHHYPHTRAQKALSDGSSSERMRTAALATFGTQLSENWSLTPVTAENCHGCEDCAPIQPNGN